MFDRILNTIRHVVPIKKKQIVIFFIWGLFSIWESYAYFNLQGPLRGVFSVDSIGYFILYHTGNINNTFIAAVIIYIALELIFRRPFMSFLVSFATVLSIFVYIEWSDPRDIPAALCGLVLFMLFVEQPTLTKKGEK